MIHKHIEIVRTNNRLFTSMGSVSCQKIYTMLSKHYRHVGISIVNTVADLEALVQKQPDLVFLGLKKLPYTDIWISDYLDKNGISYTGSNKHSTELEFDKSFAKLVVKDAGLATAASFNAVPGMYMHQQLLPLKFPLFIKPLGLGGSDGIDNLSVVRTFTQYTRKVQDIHDKFGSASLVETYLTGREFSVAILEGPTLQDKLVAVIEIVTTPDEHGDRVLTGKVKHDDYEQVLAVPDMHISTSVVQLASAVYGILGARDFGRIDIRMDAAGVPHFLEANLMPGPITRYFAGAFLVNLGISTEAVLLTIVNLGLARSTDLASLAFDMRRAVPKPTIQPQPL